MFAIATVYMHQRKVSEIPTPKEVSVLHPNRCKQIYVGSTFLSANRRGRGGAKRPHGAGIQAAAVEQRRRTAQTAA